MTIRKRVEKYIPQLKEFVSPSTLQHSLAVMQVMEELAIIYNLDPEEALLSGLLHDIAKDIKPHKQNAIVLGSYFNYFTEIEKLPTYQHGPAGALLIKKELGIDNENIFKAVCSHTFFSYQNDNSTLGWCLRIADVLAPTQEWSGRQELNELAYSGRLDLAALFLTKNLIKYFKSKEIPIIENLQHSYQRLQNSLPGMILVEGGAFRINREYLKKYPDHLVTLSSFYIDKHPVTQAEWQAVMQNNPAKFQEVAAKTDTPAGVVVPENYSSPIFRPVESVSWYEAVAFCNKKSQLAGLTPCYKIMENQTDPADIDATRWGNYAVQKISVSWDKSADGYRLPTEAEWELAAVGGIQGAIVDNQPQKQQGESTSRPVGQHGANSLGICDTANNVHEWCFDRYHAEAGSFFDNRQLINPSGPELGYPRIIRGSSCVNDFNLSCASPAYKGSTIGFRIVKNA